MGAKSHGMPDVVILAVYTNFSVHTLIEIILCFIYIVFSSIY